MGGDVETCSRCKRLLIEIDHYGERLIGCVECNRWGWPGAFMELAEEDLHALQRIRNGESYR